LEEGKLQELYSYSRAQAEQEVNARLQEYEQASLR